MTATGVTSGSASRSGSCAGRGGAGAGRVGCLDAAGRVPASLPPNTPDGGRPCSDPGLDEDGTETKHVVGISDFF